MISLIWAMGENRVIGINNKMPWHLPAELAYFKRTTLGKPVIMGRKTFESIGKPLPGRENWIITRDLQYHAEGCDIFHSVQEVLQQLPKEKEAMVIGGAEIYNLFLPHADRLYMTEIHSHFEGDTYFPDFNLEDWKLVKRSVGVKDEKNPYDHEFLVYDRK